MFEKFSNLDVDSAGRGGEYTVQVREKSRMRPVIFVCGYFPVTDVITGWIRLDEWCCPVDCQ